MGGGRKELELLKGLSSTESPMTLAYNDANLCRAWAAAGRSWSC